MRRTGPHPPQPCTTGRTPRASHPLAPLMFAEGASWPTLDHVTKLPSAPVDQRVKRWNQLTGTPAPFQVDSIKIIESNVFGPSDHKARSRSCIYRFARDREKPAAKDNGSIFWLYHSRLLSTLLA